MLFAGIDLGTTNCRCLLVERDGTPIGAASVAVPVDYAPPDRAEVAPERWWEATLAVVRDALGRAHRRPKEIAAVGLSGLMHAPVLVDEEGHALAAAQLWMDQRCVPQAEALRRHFGDRARDLDLRTSVTAPKLAWLAAHLPAALEHAHAILLPKDFIRLRLTGDVATDPSDAEGTGLYDPEKGAWRDEVAREVGVRRSQLPPVRPADAPGGTLSDAAAAATGLPAGIPVATGGADTLCTRLGVGNLEAGRLLVYLGTAAWIARVEGPDETSGVRATDAGATTASGAALSWVRGLVGATAPPPDYAFLDELAAHAPIGSGGVTFLPHLMGERAVDASPTARGSWHGLTLAHGQAHLVRSVMEGVAFQLRQLLEDGVPQLAQLGAPAFAVGGICRSAFWSQMLADVTGVGYEIPRQVEAAAQGAALLGARAAGFAAPGSVWPNPADRRVEPDADCRSVYEDGYRRFLAIERTCGHR